MNSVTKVPVFLLFAVSMFAACAGLPQFADVRDRDWNLAELRTGNGSIALDRARLAEEGWEEIYTLRFDDERAGGIGAPNRYFAPYVLAESQAIEIKTVAGTLMAAFREPEQIKEREYFNYLQNVYKWNLAKGNLELYSKTGDGTETVLVFAPK